MIKTEAYNESTQFLGLTTKNGFKAGKLYTQKPLSAADAFVVDRNLAAYRINQSGVLELMAANVPRVDYKNGCPEILIENQSTNRILQSNNFASASWVKDNLTNASGLLTTTATNTACYIAQNSVGGFVSGSNYTFSVYAKKGTANFIQLLLSSGQTVGNAFANFDLNNGTAFLGLGISASIELEDDFYRCSITYVSNVNGSNDPIIWFANSLVSIRGESFTGAIGSTLTIKNAQQELQQSSFTNTISQPNSLTLSFGGVIGTNDTTAPDGTMTADSFNVNDNAFGGTYKAITLINGNTYTYSVWLKGSVNGQKVLSQTDFNGDLLTFTLTAEWVRYSVTFVANSSSAQNIYLLNGSYVSPTSNEIYYTWGQQLEPKIFPTSYIPTTATIVTRPPDIIENNTINYDINQGTIFVRARLDFSTDVRGVITLYDGGPFENYITIYSEIIGAVKKIVFQTYTDPDENKYELTVPSNGIYNMAFAYDLTANTYAIAVNGNIEFSGTFGNITPTSSELNTLTLGRIGSFYDARVIGSMFFDSKLDNTSLENLTA
jgi:hypothetical protein